jgi:hypothetical protein
MRYNNDTMNEDIKTEEATEPVVAAPETAEIRTEDAPVVEAPVEEAKPEASDTLTAPQAPEAAVAEAGNDASDIGKESGTATEAAP